MNMFEFKKKKKPEFGVIKLFKIATADEVRRFKAFEVVDFCTQELLYYIKKDIILIEADFSNGANKIWKKYASFLNYVKQHSEHYIEIYDSYMNDGICGHLNYSNDTHRMNRKGTTMEMIDIMISFPREIVDIPFLQTFLAKLFSIETADYGYVCFLTDEYSLDFERKDKKGLFSVTSSSNKKDIEKRENIRKANTGLLENVYQINILNNAQIEVNKISDYLDKGIGIMHGIKGSNLKIWELPKEEKGKTRFPFPLVQDNTIRAGVAF
jgi:hypothetical protein